jgi:hypothetical protein
MESAGMLNMTIKNVGIEGDCMFDSEIKFIHVPGHKALVGQFIKDKLVELSEQIGNLDIAVIEGLKITITFMGRYMKENGECI